MMQITTFKWVPPHAQGYVKDLPVRWALEESGIPYTLRLISRDEANSEAYRRQQPFGQVPVLEDDGLSIFESGSILLHIGEKSKSLLSAEPAARARVRSWVFAALNSLEPYVHQFNDPNSSKEATAANLKKRLQALEYWLKGREYFENQFSVGDIMMTTITRHLVESKVLQEYPNLSGHLERCQARPAFKKALADQLKTFADNAPKA